MRRYGMPAITNRSCGSGHSNAAGGFLPQLLDRTKRGIEVKRTGRMQFRLAQAIAALSLAVGIAAPACARQAANRADAVDGEAPLENRDGVPDPPADARLPEVEPVISDSEFSTAVPSLDSEDDPQLDRPLESIAEFERRIASEEAGASPQEGQAPPLGEPALADGDRREAIGDASVRDAELAKPLPPLDTFDVEPVELAQGGEADEAAADVAYRVRVNGLDTPDRQTAAHLRSRFDDLSALRRGKGKAENLAMIAARLTEDSALVQTLLNSEGWYGASVSTRIDRSEADNGQPLTATIDVVPGKRYAFSEIRVSARPTEPAGLIRDNLALRPGEPIVADRVQGAEAKVALALPENGYPFAEVGERDILLDPESGEGVYTLPVETGPRARFGDFATEGDLAFDAAHAQVLARFRRGELYDSRKVDDLRQALVATGLFAAVSTEPVRTGQAAEEGSEYVTMLVRQDAGPPRTIAGTVGYGTGEGFRVNGSWTHRNLFPPEGALILAGAAGTKEQAAGVTFRRSNAGRRDRSFEILAEARHSQYDAYSAFTGLLGARVSYASTPIWQKRLTYAYGVNLLATAEKDFDFSAGRRNRRTYYVGGLTGQAGLDLTDDLLDPTRGARLALLVEPEGSLDGGFHPYVRARLDGSAYVPLGESLVLAGRVRLGTIQGAGLFDLAPSRRLYAGGGGSVRGFGYQKLGQQDPNGDPVGGRSLNEAAAEVRYRFGNFGIVGFVDAGQSYASTTPRFTDLRFGAGLGGRFYTNFGPMRLDVATPINRRKGESRLNIYVSIGQAF